jgi:hypothetical protein
MSEDFSVADFKAILAQHGASLHPDAKAKVLPPPSGDTMSVIVLDRVEDIEVPDYCTHGYATCIKCYKPCWLGHETERIVSSGEAYPVCIACASATIPRDKRTPYKQVRDHRRADGPH